MQVSAQLVRDSVAPRVRAASLRAPPRRRSAVCAAVDSGGQALEMRERRLLQVQPDARRASGRNGPRRRPAAYRCASGPHRYTSYDAWARGINECSRSGASVQGGEETGT